jgi:hypothetical protein
MWLEADWLCLALGRRSSRSRDVWPLSAVARHIKPKRRSTYEPQPDVGSPIAASTTSYGTSGQEYNNPLIRKEPPEIESPFYPYKLYYRWERRESTTDAYEINSVYAKPCKYPV